MSILEKDAGRVVSFELARMKYSENYNLFAILENEVKGKKKYGRKMLATKRVLIRSDLDSAKAYNLYDHYMLQLEYRNDMERVAKAVSKKDVEIVEDMKVSFIDAHSIYSLF